MSDLIQPAEPPYTPLGVTAENVEQVLTQRAALDGVRVIDPDSIDKALRGKPQFIPDFGSKNVAPGSLGSIEFPMDEVVMRLDGEPENTAADVEMTSADAWVALRQMIAWIMEVKAHDPRGVKSIGIRFIAAAWILNPQLFDDAPAHAVAKSWGLYHQAFSQHAADFSRFFKVQNRFQAHDSKNPRRQIISP